MEAQESHTQTHRHMFSWMHWDPMGHNKITFLWRYLTYVYVLKLQKGVDVLTMLLHKYLLYKFIHGEKEWI